MAVESKAGKKRRAKPVPDGATWLTPPQIAERMQCAPETVTGWIESGELRAMNVARRGSKRPRYRVTIDDLSSFEARRSVVAPSRRGTTSRPARDLDVTQYV